LVFLASGFWHGAAWGFIAWGAYHGFFLVIERLFLSKYLSKLGKFSAVYTFFVVLIGWVFFRIEHLRPSISYLQRMFSWHNDTALWYADGEFLSMLAIAAFFSFFTLSAPGARIQDKVFNTAYTMRRHWLMLVVTILLCIVTAGRITVSDFNPFIYFRF